MLGSKQQSHISPAAPVRVTLDGLTQLLDISPDALVGVDRAGTIFMVNEQAETLFGYAHGELPGQQLKVLLPENLRARHALQVERYFSAPRTRPLGTGLQLAGRRKDGSEFPADISLRPILLDTALYVIGAVRDVTEKKRMEEIHNQLLQREQQAKEAEREMAHLRSLFAQAPVHMNIYRGPEHIFEFMHPLARETLGGRDFTGMKIRDALPEIQGQGHFERMDRVYQTGETLIETERSVLLKAENGELVEHFFNTTCAPWYDLEGHIAGLLQFSIEVTEQVGARRQLEESEARLRNQASELEHMNAELRGQRDELILLNADLERANRGRQFFSTMSHELRTPLASIIGFSQLLLADAEEASWDQQQKTNLERILKNGQHLLNLINDVLDLVKIEAGRMEISFTQVDVRELINWVVEETHSLAIEKKLDVSIYIEDEVSYLESNPVKLRQVLLNLVSNALKYTESGKVTISATRVGADHLVLAVEDTGIGISADRQWRIFEAFYQVDGSYTRKSGGTGLGLAIVSQLTGLLGGRIELKSAPGQGSTFTVIVPIKAINRRFEQDTPRLHPGPPDGYKAVRNSAASPAEAREERFNLVLAVDDDPDVIALIKTSLQDSPYSVIGVQDPLKLIELVQEMHPCAITLDVLMPELSGWQILRQLKSNPATSSIPVIMLTVLAEPGAGYGLGADDYLIKPFQKERLLKTLQNLLASHKASSQANKPENSERIAAIQIQ